MQFFRGKALLPVFFVLLLSTEISSGSSGECREEHVIIQYTTANGKDPGPIDIDPKTLLKSAKNIVNSTILAALSKVSSILDIGENIKTDNIFRHVHIICAHRFIHLGKPLDWEITYYKKITDANGVDHFQPNDVNYVTSGKITEITNKLQETLEAHCERNCR